MIPFMLYVLAICVLILCVIFGVSRFNSIRDDAAWEIEQGNHVRGVALGIVSLAVMFAMISVGGLAYVTLTRLTVWFLP